MAKNLLKYKFDLFEIIVDLFTKSDIKRRDTLDCLEQYTCSWDWNRHGHEAV